MIFVFEDDGILDIISDKSEAKKYEGIDVESKVFRFFDERGRYLEPRFTRPNRKFLGFIFSGEFDFVPSVNTDGDDIHTLLAKTTALNPNPWFKSLDEVRRYLTK